MYWKWLQVVSIVTREVVSIVVAYDNIRKFIPYVFPTTGKWWSFVRGHPKGIEPMILRSLACWVYQLGHRALWCQFYRVNTWTFLFTTVFVFNTYVITYKWPDLRRDHPPYVSDPDHALIFRVLHIFPLYSRKFKTPWWWNGGQAKTNSEVIPTFV